MVIDFLLTKSEYFWLNAITSVKDRTWETTKSFRYEFNDILNSATDATASPLKVKFKITSTLAIFRLSIKTAPLSL